MHMNRHNGKKKYVCNVCDKTFTYPTVLKMHKRIHLGIKKFTCKECNTSFIQSNHLKVLQIFIYIFSFCIKFTINCILEPHEDSF